MKKLFAIIVCLSCTFQSLTINVKALEYNNYTNTNEDIVTNESIEQNIDTISDSEMFENSISIYDCSTGEVTTQSINANSDSTTMVFSNTCEKYSPPFEGENSNTNTLLNSDVQPRLSSDEATKIVNPVTAGNGQYKSTVCIKGYDSNNKLISEGTGFFVGPNTVVTAGHVIYVENENTKNRDWAYRVVVTPAQSGPNYKPYGHSSASNLIISDSYASEKSFSEDWGIIRLNSNLGNQTGWLSLAYTPYPWTNNVSANGYPGMVSGVSNNDYMYRVDGLSILSNDGEQLMTVLGASGLQGMSGGPTYYFDLINGYTIIGILVSSYSRENSWNYLKFDKPLYELIVSFQSQRAPTYK